MTDDAPDNHKNHRLFILTSAMNLVFMVILAVYFHSQMQSGAAQMLGSAAPSGGSLSQFFYVILPPILGVVGLLLAIVWKPLRRGVIVILALYYVLVMSILLLVGYADVVNALGSLNPVSADTFLAFGILAVLIFLFIWNLRSLKNLDLPSIFGKP